MPTKYAPPRYERLVNSDYVVYGHPRWPSCSWWIVPGTSKSMGVA